MNLHFWQVTSDGYVVGLGPHWCFRRTFHWLSRKVAKDHFRCIFIFLNIPKNYFGSIYHHFSQRRLRSWIRFSTVEYTVGTQIYLNSVLINHGLLNRISFKWLINEKRATAKGFSPCDSGHNPMTTIKKQNKGVNLACKKPSSTLLAS